MSTSSQSIVFDKKLRIKHLDACALNEDAHVYDYLRDHVAKDMCDRIDDLSSPFKRDILNIGSCSGLVIKNLNADRVNSLIQTDISENNIKRCKRLTNMLPPKFPVDYINCDEEKLPFKNKSIDLAMSCLTLHWVNDLMACFRQIHNILKEDCPFMGAMFGGDTLYELRSSLQLAELERLSGFSSHVAPKTTGQDIARLLQANGFQMITVDIAELRIHYPSIYELMFDLQGMGESNKSLIGNKHLYRDILQATAAVYQTMYGQSNLENGVPATFQIIHFIGWKGSSNKSKDR